MAKPSDVKAKLADMSLAAQVCVYVCLYMRGTQMTMPVTVCLCVCWYDTNVGFAIPQLIRASSKLSVSGLHKIVQGWKDDQISDLSSNMQALALVPKDIETQLQVSTYMCNADI